MTVVMHPPPIFFAPYPAINPLKRFRMTVWLKYVYYSDAASNRNVNVDCMNKWCYSECSSAGDRRFSALRTFVGGTGSRVGMRVDSVDTVCGMRRVS